MLYKKRKAVGKKRLICWYVCDEVNAQTIAHIYILVIARCILDFNKEKYWLSHQMCN